MVKHISQSLIKAMRAYNAGEECGVLVEEQYVKGNLVELDSDSVAEGAYFEYILTGGLPKSGKFPEPEYMLTPLKKKKPEDLEIADMTAEYRRAHANADQVKALWKELGLEIHKDSGGNPIVGRKFTKGRFEGTIDIVMVCTKRIDWGNGIVWEVGDLIVVDVKYSGLLHDEYNKHGWMFKRDIQKEYHGTQAKQYHFITSLPFYFLVVGNTNKEVENEAGKKEFAKADIRFIHVPVDKHMIDTHLNEGVKLYEELELQSVMGLVPRPSFSRCAKCTLFDKCTDKHTYPHVEVVDITLGV